MGWCLGCQRRAAVQASRVPKVLTVPRPAITDICACALPVGTSPAPEGTTGNFTTPPPEFDNNTASNVGGNAANAGGNAANTGSNAANTGGNAANAGANTANAGDNAANAGGNAAPQIDAALVVVARPSPRPSPAANVAASPDTSTNVIGANTAGGGNAAGLTGTTGAIEGTGMSPTPTVVK